MGVASGRLAVGSALMLTHLFAAERPSPSARERVPPAEADRTLREDVHTPASLSAASALAELVPVPSTSRTSMTNTARPAGVWRTAWGNGSVRSRMTWGGTQTTTYTGGGGHRGTTASLGRTR